MLTYTVLSSPSSYLFIGLRKATTREMAGNAAFHRIPSLHQGLVPFSSGNRKVHSNTRMWRRNPQLEHPSSDQRGVGVKPKSRLLPQPHTLCPLLIRGTLKTPRLDVQKPTYFVRQGGAFSQKLLAVVRAAPFHTIISPRSYWTYLVESLQWAEH